MIYQVGTVTKRNVSWFHLSSDEFVSDFFLSYRFLPTLQINLFPSRLVWVFPFLHFICSLFPSTTSNVTRHETVDDVTKFSEEEFKPNMNPSLLEAGREQVSVQPIYPTHYDHKEVFIKLHHIVQPANPVNDNSDETCKYFSKYMHSQGYS